MNTIVTLWVLVVSGQPSTVRVHDDQNACLKDADTTIAQIQDMRDHGQLSGSLSVRCEAHTVRVEVGK